MSWIDIMFVLGIALGYLIGWAHHRHKPLRRVILTCSPQDYPVGAVLNGWRILSVKSLEPCDELNGLALVWCVDAEVVE